MKKYIERSKLINTLANETSHCLSFLKNGEARGLIIARDIVRKTPAADVELVKHGKWEIKSEIHQMLDDVDEEIYVKCPYCKRTFYVPFEFEDEKILAYARENYPYCNCGAKMDGGSE